MKYHSRMHRHCGTDMADSLSKTRCGKFCSKDGIWEKRRRKGNKGGSDGGKKRIKSHFIEKGGKKSGRKMYVCMLYTFTKACTIYLEARRGYSVFLYHSLSCYWGRRSLNLELLICLTWLSRELLESVYLHSFPHRTGVIDKLLCAASMWVTRIQTGVPKLAQ